MYKLLIVDDEPYTVEGLFEMLSNLPDMKLELYKAYSSEEALLRLGKTKIDIVLSDLRMPGMDGLELQQWITKRWPRCKIIFLTGISDILPMQQAIRNGGIDYVLKTEGDEAIVAAIQIALQQLEEEASHDKFLVQARDQVALTLPFMQREWFFELLHSRSGYLHNSRLNELNITLSESCDVLLVLGRIDLWPEDYSLSNRALLMYAIQNIALEYLERVLILPIILDESHFVWLIQPTLTDQRHHDYPQDVISYVISSLDSIQQTSKKLLQVPVSLVSNGKAIGWNEVPNTFNTLKQTMILGLGDGENMLITHELSEMSKNIYRPITYLRLIELERDLEAGRQHEFELELHILFDNLTNKYEHYAQTYYAIAAMLLGQLNLFEYRNEEHKLQDIQTLMDLKKHVSKDRAVEYLKETARYLFEQNRRTKDERTHSIITHVNQYIRQHLDGDLSLDVLSDVVFLNPSYLSSLYKQCTGNNLSDYIAEMRIRKAKQLLSNASLKIHEVGITVGYGTAGYFTRFFKKHTGLTPQEYKNSLDH